MENEEMTPTSEVCAVPLSVLRFGPVRFGTVRSNAVRMMSLSVMKDVAITEPKVSRPTCVTVASSVAMYTIFVCRDDSCTAIVIDIGSSLASTIALSRNGTQRSTSEAFDTVIGKVETKL